MQLTTVTLDGIFDVVSGMRSRKEVTNFGFQSGALCKVFVPAPGKPSLIEGTVITACLLENDNWQTLKGWVNHSNGDIAIEGTGYEWFSIVWCTAIAAFALATVRSEPLLSGCILAAVLAWSLHCAYSINLLSKVRKKLEQVKQKISDPLKVTDAI
jgi:hypothetical protein